MKRDCHDCGKRVPADARVCPYCSAELVAGAARAAPRAPDYGRCEWEHKGERCHYAGSMSSITVGGGPWYCGEHYTAMQREDAQEDGAKIVEKSRHDVPRPDYNYEKRRLMALKAMALRGKPVTEAV